MTGIKCVFRWVLALAMVIGMVCDTAAQQEKPKRSAKKAYTEAISLYTLGLLPEAAEALDVAIAKSPTYANAWFFKAQIFKEMNHPDQDEVLSQALALDGSAYRKGWLELAEMQWTSGRYESAKASLDRFVEGGLEGVSQQTLEHHRWILAGVEYSLEAMATPVDTMAVPVPGNLSGKAHMYYGSVDLSGNRMVFTLDNEGASLAADLGGEDIWEARRLPNGDWTAPTPLRGINTPTNEGAPAISGDGRTIIFTVCASLDYGYGGKRRGKGSCDLFESTWSDTLQSWSQGKNLGAPNSAGKETQPSLSSDGNTLLFARAPRGLDQPTDLFVSHRLAHGGWSTPKRLEGAVNTSRYEESPFLHPDGKTLYFSSDGHPGLGDLDVFVSRKLPDGTWGEPTNLGPSINGPGKDNSLMVMPRGNEALFSTNRDTGWDSFWTIPLKEEAKPIEVAMLKGVIQDATTMAYLEAEVSLLDATNGQTIGKSMSKGEEGFMMPLPGLGSYTLQVSKEGYMFQSVSYEQEEGEALNRSPFKAIAMDKIEEGQGLDLNAIRFQYGSATLESTYQGDLERLHAWLLENPGLEIEIIGHTDSIGSVPYNMQLSLDRAESVKGFMVERGIDEGRMTTDGKGPLLPIDTNRTEEGRARNRRVQVVVIR